MSDEDYKFVENSDEMFEFTRILVMDFRRGAIYFTISENNEMRRSGRYYTHAGLNWMQEDKGKHFFVSNNNSQLQVRKVNPDKMPVRKGADNSVPFLRGQKVFLVNKDKRFAQILINGEVIEIDTPKCVQFMYVLPHDFFSVVVSEKMVGGEVKRRLNLIDCDMPKEDKPLRPMSEEDFFRMVLPMLENNPELLTKEVIDDVYNRAKAIVANVPEGIRMLTDSMVRTRMITPGFAKDFCYKVISAKH